MNFETSIVNVLGKYNIYCELYKRDDAAETVILVNGAFSTTTSFSLWVRHLKDKLNIVLFDLPYVGGSKEHNASGKILTKQDEVDILEHLIHRFHVDYLVSISWGGVSSLLALARRPSSIKKAIIGSFSPVINRAMHDYMAGARHFLETGDVSGAARLLNATVGQHLPSKIQTHNFNYLQSSVKGSEEQIIFHINQIFEFDGQQMMHQFAKIDVPILFLNGELDNYTTAEEVKTLASCIPQSTFAVLKRAGHFLDLESRQLWNTVSSILRGHLFEESTELTGINLGAFLHQEAALTVAGD